MRARNPRHPEEAKRPSGPSGDASRGGSSRSLRSLRMTVAPVVAFFGVAALIVGVFAVLHVSVQTVDNSQEAKLAAAEASITDADSLRKVVEMAGFEKPTIKAKFLSTELSENATKIDVSNQTSPLNITRAGMFILTGTNDDLQVIVNAPETAEVRIVLDNANIASQTGAVIDSESADHTIVIAKAGTANSLTDAPAGWVDEETEEHTPNGVIYAVSDLVVIGEGQLKINARGKYAISSHDDINLNANLAVVSQGSAIHGTDSVYVLGGTYAISSGNDGMHAKDNLIITGGEINIVASDDGVNASDQNAESAGGEGDPTPSSRGRLADRRDPEEGASWDGERGNHPVTSDTPPREGNLPPDGERPEGEWTDGERPGRPRFDMDNPEGGAPPTDGSARGGGFRGGGGGGFGREQALNNVWLYVSGGTITVNINGRGDGIDSNGHILQTGGIIYSNDSATGGDGPYDYNGIYAFYPENGAELWANGTQLSEPVNTM